MLTQVQVDEFHDRGVLILRNFYDIETEIRPILHAIYELVGLLIDRDGLDIARDPFRPETFDSGFMEMIARDRQLGGILYDAMKQIPAFLRLVSSEKNQRLFEILFDTSLCGIGHRSQGIRIDIPGEEKFKSPWHQEFLAHMRSKNGLVFWAPLREITEQLGPVEVCPGSHRDGIYPLTSKDPDNPEKYGAYAMRLADEDNLLKRFSTIKPLTGPGDLILLDWLVLHRSSSNLDTRPRWAMQMRFFDFTEPTGLDLGWPGGVVAGEDVTRFYPELVRDD